MLSEAPTRDAPSACPNCGHDLCSLATFHVGDLSIIDGGVTMLWRGVKVRMTAAQRLLVKALASSAGHVMKNPALIEAVGSDSDNPINLVNVHACRIRALFRAIDPAFDRIETIWGVGLRWRVET